MAEHSAFGEWIGAGVAAVIAAGLGLRKWFQGDRVNEAASRAEAEVITMLRDEVKRLSERADMLGESNVHLSRQVRELTQANLALMQTVHTLQGQIRRLPHYHEEQP